MAKPPSDFRHSGSRSVDRTKSPGRPDNGPRPRFEPAKPRGDNPEGQRPFPRGAQRPPREETPAGISLLWGYHTVREALRAPRRRIHRLIATQAAAERLAEEIAARGLKPVIVEADAIAQRLPQDAVHQGLLAEVRPLEPIQLSELPANGIVLVLDQITDPHNFGAILRTAAAFGVDAVITTERHSPSQSGILAKSASGALEHVPLCPVVNLARAMEALEDMNYQRIGLDSDAPASLEDLELTRPLALVLGAEGKGLRRLTRENCNALVRLDLPGPIRSLNVSNACAAALTMVRMKLRAP